MKIIEDGIADGKTLFTKISLQMNYRDSMHKYIMGVYSDDSCESLIDTIGFEGGYSTIDKGQNYYDLNLTSSSPQVSSDLYTHIYIVPGAEGGVDKAFLANDFYGKKGILIPTELAI